MRVFAMATLAFAAIFGWAIGGGKFILVGPATAPAAVAAMPTEDEPRAHAGTVIIARGWEGHFFTDGDVAGKELRFIVDTGATTVALSREDAQIVGIDVSKLSFDHEGRTAGGTTRYATVTLSRLRIGDIQLTDVGTVVLDVAQGTPLLGESFLSRIDKVSIEGDRMTLTKL